jgi:hypothetical protein
MAVKITLNCVYVGTTIHSRDQLKKWATMVEYLRNQISKTIPKTRIKNVVNEKKKKL